VEKANEKQREKDKSLESVTTFAIPLTFWFMSTALLWTGNKSLLLLAEEGEEH